MPALPQWGAGTEVAWLLVSWRFSWHQLFRESQWAWVLHIFGPLTLSSCRITCLLQVPVDMGALKVLLEHFPSLRLLAFKGLLWLVLLYYLVWQELKGHPCLGCSIAWWSRDSKSPPDLYLLYCLAYQALKGPPSLGSFSIGQWDFMDLDIPFQWSGTPVCYQWMLCKILCIWRWIHEEKRTPCPPIPSASWDHWEISKLYSLKILIHFHLFWNPVLLPEI